MTYIAGIALIVFGAMLLYSILNKSSKTEGAKNGLILAAIMIFIGGYVVYDAHEKKKRKAKLEQERALYLQHRKLCSMCGGSGCKWCHYTGYIGTNTFKGSATNLTCGANDCDCKIKRSELEAGGLSRCSCGHLTSWHHN